MALINDINDEEKNLNFENLKRYDKNIKEIIPKEKELTQAEYDNLSEAEKNNGTTYFIKDGVSTGSNGSTVEKSDTNGNILVNDEEVQVYDDTELQGQIDNLSSKFEDTGTEVTPIYIENGEFKQVTHELSTDVPPGGTTYQFLRGDGKWASPEYSPDVVVTNFSFDTFLRKDITAGYSLTNSYQKTVDLLANKNYKLYYNGFVISPKYITGYLCTVKITLEDNRSDTSNINIKTILNTTSSAPQVLELSTEDYANPILRVVYTYKLVPALDNTSYYTKNNVKVIGAGDKFDWGKPQRLDLGTLIQFDTSNLTKWTTFNVAVCNSNYQNQKFITHEVSDGEHIRGDSSLGYFYFAYDKTTKILSVCHKVTYGF